MSQRDPFNKSLNTNLAAGTCFAMGFLLPEPYRNHVSQMGLFALSGAATNWIAVHMLFERVPGLYGSGIIPLHFQEVRKGIHDLLMHQFFTDENVARFLSASNADNSSSVINLDPVLDKTDFSPAFEALVDAVKESSLGSMLSLVGGPTALEPLRDPFHQKLRQAIQSIAASEPFQATLRENLKSTTESEGILERISQIVNARLDELTPEMAKEIVQTMIRKHLGWLVVWGGVVGGIIGLAASFLL